MSNLGTATQTVVDAITLAGSGLITYQFQLRVRVKAPLKTYTGGTVVQEFVNKDGTPATDNVELVKLEVSNPAATFYLNAGVSGSPASCVFNDYMLTVPAKGNATLTVTVDTIDGVVPAELILGEDSINDPENSVLDDFSGVFCQIDHDETYVSTEITELKGGGVRGFKFGGLSEEVLRDGAEQ
jgi:hypothetical protein